MRRVPGWVIGQYLQHPRLRGQRHLQMMCLDRNQRLIGLTDSRSSKTIVTGTSVKLKQYESSNSHHCFTGHHDQLMFQDSHHTRRQTKENRKQSHHSTLQLSKQAPRQAPRDRASSSWSDPLPAIGARHVHIEDDS